MSKPDIASDLQILIDDHTPYPDDNECPVCGCEAPCTTIEISEEALRTINHLRLRNRTLRSDYEAAKARAG